MKKILSISLISFVSLFFIFSMWLNAYGAVYETSNLRVTYEKKIDLKCAIVGTEKARIFFSELGYKSDYPVDITFKDIVYHDDKKINRIYGIYNGKNQKITISSWGTDYIKNRKCFGLASNIKIHESIISHEVAHSLLWFIAGKCGHGVNEYVAYTVQLNVIDKDELKRILEYNKNVDSHEPSIPIGINSFCHAASPHEFGIMSYLHFAKYGRQIFDDIIKGVFDPDKEMNSLVNPGG